MVNKIQLVDVSKSYTPGKPVIQNLFLNIKEGSFTVLLGPSGCGKSTILRMIAGLEKETSGEIFIDGKSVSNVEPGDRNIAMVFQNYALYPTMTVRGNIEFGLKNNKLPKDEREKRIHEISEIVGLTEFLDRKPQSLSGGQRQRVALARAIVKKPSVFLMDEPLSNLDAKLRSQIRTDLIELYRRLKTTFVYVTHDQIEAMSMGTDIVLLNQGEIQQFDTPHNIYTYPKNIFTAEFIGTPPMNVISAACLEESHMPAKTTAVGFRPEHVSPVAENAEPSPDYLYITGRLITHEMLGSEVLYRLETPWGKLNMKLYEDMDLSYGEITVRVRKDQLHFFGENNDILRGVKVG